MVPEEQEIQTGFRGPGFSFPQEPEDVDQQYAHWKEITQRKMLLLHPYSLHAMLTKTKNSPEA